MEDFKAMLRILAAVYAREKANGGLEYLDERIVKTDDKTRDILLMKLQKQGYIEGLHIVESVDGQRVPVILWQDSFPTVTFSGMQFMDGNETAKAVLREIKDAAVSLAAQTFGTIIAGQIK